jgi:hypothetical protein
VLAGRVDVAAVPEFISACAYTGSRGGCRRRVLGAELTIAAAAGACLAGSSGHLWVEEMEDGMGPQLDGGFRVQSIGFRVQSSVRVSGGFGVRSPDTNTFVPARGQPLRMRVVGAGACAGTQAWIRRCRATLRTLT